MNTNPKNLDALIAQKEVLREDFAAHSDDVRAFLYALGDLSFEELKRLFPAKRAVVEQNVFDYTTKLYEADSHGNQGEEKNLLASYGKVALAVFKPSAMKKHDSENFKKDTELLQAIFFFFLQNLAEGQDCGTVFAEALSDGSWCSGERQGEILNLLAKNLHFKKVRPFSSVDFLKFTGNHFQANECILRVLFNFMRKKPYSKEGIVNELNFVREQQKAVLEVWPNRRKTNYTEASANAEIKSKLDNLKKLRQIDFGFSVPGFAQYFFYDSANPRKEFVRPIECKCFQESEMEWEREPHKERFHDGIKIFAEKSARATNKSALRHKFLYPERNMLTHISEHFAVHKLFTKDFGEEMAWEDLVLHSLFDAHEYIKSLSESEEKRKLLRILNYYFKKIVSTVQGGEKSAEELWAEVFDKDGSNRIESRELGKTNLYKVFAESESEITHFRKFMSFLYCSENEVHDFFEKNMFEIQLYLLYLTFEFAKLDKMDETR